MHPIIWTDTRRLRSIRWSEALKKLQRSERSRPLTKHHQITLRDMVDLMPSFGDMRHVNQHNAKKRKVRFSNVIWNWSSFLCTQNAKKQKIATIPLRNAGSGARIKQDPQHKQSVNNVMKMSSSGQPPALSISAHIFAETPESTKFGNKCACTCSLKV